MNDCSQSTDRSSKRGVTFDAMETLERHSDSIDKLTSLFSKMNVKMDKKETPYKPRVYQGRPRGQNRGRQQNLSPTIGLSAGIGIEVEEIIIVGTIIGPTIEIDPEKIADKTIRETTTDSNERWLNYRQDSRRRDSYRQDNRNRQNYRRK